MGWSCWKDGNRVHAGCRKVLPQHTGHYPPSITLPLTILAMAILFRQQYQKLRKEGLQLTGSTPNTPQRNKAGVSQPTGVVKSPTRRGRPRGKRPLVDRHEPEEDDEGGGENKKVKKEGEQSKLGLRMILKTEPVDNEGIVRLDDDELSRSHSMYHWLGWLLTEIRSLYQWTTTGKGIFFLPKCPYMYLACEGYFLKGHNFLE